jgi:hypothetical protein
MGIDILSDLNGPSASGFPAIQTAPVAPDGNHYEFYIEAVHMPYKSEMENRPVYEDHEFLRIITGASNGKNIRCRPVTDDDRRRFAYQYEQFKSGLEQRGTGLPLEEWAPLSRAQVLELKAIKIYTVEQLSEIPDSGLAGMGMGARDLREKARRFVTSATSGAPLEALARENKDLKAELDVLREQFTELLKASKNKDK